MEVFSEFYTTPLPAFRSTSLQMVVDHIVVVDNMLVGLGTWQFLADSEMLRAY